MIRAHHLQARLIWLILLLMMSAPIHAGEEQKNKEERTLEEELQEVRLLVKKAETESDKSKETKVGDQVEAGELPALPKDEDTLIKFVREWKGKDASWREKKQMAEAIKALGEIKSAKAVPVLLDKLDFRYSEPVKTKGMSSEGMFDFAILSQPFPSLLECVPAIAVLQRLGARAIEPTLSRYIKTRDTTKFILPEAVLTGIKNSDAVLRAIQRSTNATEDKKIRKHLDMLAKKVKQAAKKRGERKKQKTTAGGGKPKKGEALISTEQDLARDHP